MLQIRFSFVLIVFTLILSLIYKVQSRKLSKALIFAVGGLRHDYVKAMDLKGFKTMIKNGVYVPIVYPVYPTLMYPNLYSLATGLYPENHGIVGDIMYNNATGEYFMPSHGSTKDEVKWWNEAEPIWTTAERNDLKTALYWWPGCEVLINNTHTTACEYYRTDIVTGDHIMNHMQERLEVVLDMFKHDDLNLAMFYYGLSSGKGLEFGPDSSNMKKSLETINNFLQRSFKRIKEEKLYSEVNVLVTSDSGLIGINHSTVQHLDLQPYSRYIELQISFGAMSMILPTPGSELMLFMELQNARMKGLHVYQKKNIPDEYHIKNSDRVLPILLQADPGFLIDPLPDSRKVRGSDLTKQNGIQGYDPFKVLDMRTTFLASGPGFKQGVEVPELSIVDLYNVLCHSIGLVPLRNNGSLMKVQSMFADFSPGTKISGQTVMCASSFTVLISITAIYLAFQLNPS